MSFEATAWATKVRGIKPATKLVLIMLADCHNPDHGCFPSQAYLADACEMSERSVRDQLTKLEGLGLITRHHRSKAGTQFKSDYYELHFDRGLSDPEKPAAKFAGEGQKPAAKFAGEGERPAANHDKSQRQNLPPNPVKGISKNARATHAPAREAAPRPLPNCFTCIPAGSSFEAGWDDWLRKHGYPPLSKLSPPVGDGFDAPWKLPPSADDALKNTLAEKWADWCLQRPGQKAA